MKTRILVLGAGFGGLELTTLLSEARGDALDVTLIDQAESFVFGYAKLDVMFGKKELSEVQCSYRGFAKPGVRLLRETVTAIDPESRRVTTDRGAHEADVLVIALGADYDVSGTPGIVLRQNEFYSLEGAVHLRRVLPTFTRGHAVIGCVSAPYKCPPAPSECALMLHDYLVERGVRGACTITMMNAMSSPVPPSPDATAALLSAFAERGIQYFATRAVASVDPERRMVRLDDGRELPCDLFLGIPRNRAPDVVVQAGLSEDGWVKIDPRTLETPFPNVYAIGDLANTGAPKAGIFAEGSARVVGKNIIARLEHQDPSARNPGAGSCYIEFGAGRIARVDVDFFSGPKPTGIFHDPSQTLRGEKDAFGATRRARWFRE